MSSKADCVHCRRGSGGVSVPWALGFRLWSFKLSHFVIHFVINGNGQGHNVRSWSRLDLSRKKPKFQAEPKITVSENSLWVSWSFCCFSSRGRGSGQGELPLWKGGAGAQPLRWELCSWICFRVKPALCSGSLPKSRFSLPEGYYKLVRGRSRRLLGLGWLAWLPSSWQRSYIHVMNCISSYLAWSRPPLQTSRCPLCLLGNQGAVSGVLSWNWPHIFILSERLNSPSISPADTAPSLAVRVAAASRNLY